MTTEPYYADAAVTLLAGDCLDVLPTLPDASVDAVVCDPPYGLGFMGKAWDSTFTPGDSPMRRNAAMDAVNTGASRQGGRQRASDDYAKRQARDSRSYGEWCEQWAAECLRVLKPGGHLLAFGGTRTYHRITCAVEDAGFEIRDSISWLYGSGFPKSLDVSKAIDKAAGAEREVIRERYTVKRIKPGATVVAEGQWGKQDLDYTATDTAPATEDAARWQGWGTALKPSHEPIVVGRKPLAGTVAANVLAHGTGALNVDGCRVGRIDGDRTEYGRERHLPHANTTASLGTFAEVTPYAPHDAGRWPTNVLLDESQAEALDAQTGVLTSGALDRSKITAQNGDGWRFNGERSGEYTADSGGASRFFPIFGEVNTCSESGSGTGMNGEPDGSPSAAGLSTNAPAAGNASSDFPTFHYEAKAGSAERPSVDGVLHPTVKPLDLMRWLVRLVTPHGGIVLDPFLGSGTTAEACVIEGFRCIGIEREATYLPLIVARLSKPIETVLDFGEAS